MTILLSSLFFVFFKLLSSFFLNHPVSEPSFMLDELMLKLTNVIVINHFFF